MEQTFQDFLTSQSAPVGLRAFLANIALCAALAWCLGRVYVRFGTTFSHRAPFAGNFVLLATTTMLIITVVKYSLALSLGLVGALSIVRFRAPVKEPEELAYLFLAIGLGLGFGADQGLVTSLAFAFIGTCIVLRAWRARAEDRKEVYLDVTVPAEGAPSAQGVIEVLRAHCRAVDLKRFHESSEGLELSCMVALEGVASLDALRGALRARHPAARLSFLDPKGLV
ncbi:MAG: DUF4956 domain-containing protein [Planctomycetes bacterium]|nr:DUF4956 domain-containing protein [Planctomycetota bacterium]